MLSLLGASAGGKVVAVKPTLQYRGSYSSNRGKFQITNYDPFLTYVASGGTVQFDSGLGMWILAVADANGGASLTAANPRNPIASASVTAYRKAPDQTSVPYTQYNNPCGDCNTSVNPNTWSCGCVGADAGGGQWGVCICRGPGYSYWNNYSGAGYAWNGGNYASDGSNGEWWKVV